MNSPILAPQSASENAQQAWSSEEACSDYLSTTDQPHNICSNTKKPSYGKSDVETLRSEERIADANVSVDDNKKSCIESVPKTKGEFNLLEDAVNIAENPSISSTEESKQVLQEQNLHKKRDDIVNTTEDCKQKFSESESVAQEIKALEQESPELSKYYKTCHWKLKDIFSDSGTRCSADIPFHEWFFVMVMDILPFFRKLLFIIIHNLYSFFRENQLRGEADTITKIVRDICTPDNLTLNVKIIAVEMTKERKKAILHPEITRLTKKQKLTAWLTSKKKKIEKTCLFKVERYNTESKAVLLALEDVKLVRNHLIKNIEVINNSVSLVDECLRAIRESRSSSVSQSVKKNEPTNLWWKCLARIIIQLLKVLFGIFTQDTLNTEKPFLVDLVEGEAICEISI